MNNAVKYINLIIVTLMFAVQSASFEQIHKELVTLYQQHVEPLPTPNLLDNPLITALQKEASQAHFDKDAFLIHLLNNSYASWQKQQAIILNFPTEQYDLAHASERFPDSADRALYHYFVDHNEHNKGTKAINRTLSPYHFRIIDTPENAIKVVKEYAADRRLYCALVTAALAIGASSYKAATITMPLRPSQLGANPLEMITLYEWPLYAQALMDLSIDPNGYGYSGFRILSAIQTPEVARILRAKKCTHL